MSLFDLIFGKSVTAQPQPNIRFGRYSDSYKSREKYDLWENALEKFDDEDYLAAYRDFFNYLKDENEENIKWWEEKGKLYFELYQGSKKITGWADDLKIKAEAKVAKTDQLNVGFLRRLMEQNFNLKYGRFALDEDKNITVVFNSSTIDGSPYKLYYALKEIATKADKQDDLLLDEFETLQAVDTSHLRELHPDEKSVKYAFINKQIKDAFKEIDHGKLAFEQYPGAVAYLLLNLTYKLDFLTNPEGYMMEALERIHRLYFAKDNKSTSQKNVILEREFQLLLERPQEEYFKEMYRGTSTFGITAPVNHDKVVSFIDGELHNMDWYNENGYNAVACAIPGYIIGFCLFNYAVPRPIWDLFLLYFQIIENEYFTNLGYSFNYLDQQNNSFDRKAIKRALGDLEDKHEDVYPRFKLSVNTLNFSSCANFAKSYLLMIRE
ncbi:MAG: hypothetical protein AB8G22_07810 [Saprospiraceae bacterium]